MKTIAKIADVIFTASLIIFVSYLLLIGVDDMFIKNHKGISQLDRIESNQVEILKQLGEMRKELDQIYILFTPVQPEDIDANSLRNADGIWRKQ